MNTQDIIHQAQDVFDRVTHRSSPLLPVHMECKYGKFYTGSSCISREVYMLSITNQPQY